MDAWPMITTLRRRGAIPIKGPLYGGVIPPQGPRRGVFYE